MAVGLTLRCIYLFPHMLTADPSRTVLRGSEGGGGGGTGQVSDSGVGWRSLAAQPDEVAWVLLFLLSIDLSVAHGVGASAGGTASAFSVSEDVL